MVESPNVITNGLTFEDLASLDSTSSNYSASYLRSALNSDTSSSMSGSTYRPRGSYNSQQRNTLSSPFDDGAYKLDSLEQTVTYNVYSLREQELFQQDAVPLEFEGESTPSKACEVSTTVSKQIHKQIPKVALNFTKWKLQQKMT